MGWDYYITSASRATLILGYILSSVVVTMVFNTVMILIGFISIISTILVSFLITLAVSPFIMFFMTLINSREQVGIVTGVIGVLSGFLAGIYVPFNDMPGFATTVSGLTPFPHAVYILSNVLYGDVYTELFGHLASSSGAVDEMKTLFVLDFEFLGISSTYLISSLVVLGYGLVFFILTFFKIRNEKIK